MKKKVELIKEGLSVIKVCESAIKKHLIQMQREQLTYFNDIRPFTNALDELQKQRECNELTINTYETLNKVKHAN